MLRNLQEMRILFKFFGDCESVCVRMCFAVMFANVDTPESPFPALASFHGFPFQPVECFEARTDKELMRPVDGCMVCHKRTVCSQAKLHARKAKDLWNAKCFVQTTCYDFKEVPRVLPE